jgi:rod shape-determining protein MreD
MTDKHYSYFHIVISFVIAIFITFIPLPDFLKILKFDIIVLLSYLWIILTPHKFSILSAAFMGIVVDIIYGSLLGENIFSLSLTSAIIIVFYRYFKMLPLFQQGVLISALVFVYRGSNLWLNGLAGIKTPDLLVYFANPILVILIWPLLVSILSIFGNAVKKY